MGVLGGDAIELTVINTEATAFVLLFSHHDSNSRRAGAGRENAVFKHLLYLVVLLINDGVLPLKKCPDREIWASLYRWWVAMLPDAHGLSSPGMTGRFCHILWLLLFPSALVGEREGTSDWSGVVVTLRGEHWVGILG